MMNTTTLSPVDESARRWRQWQADYAASSRRTTQIARVVFGVAFTATAVWLGGQLMR
jgi:hypothetical protein